MYLVLDDFHIGLDLRKGPVTAPAQSLRVLKNAVITAGGEIEKRKAFVRHASVPGSIGLYGANDEFVVFAPGAAGVRTPVTPRLNTFGLSGLVAGSTMLAAQFWQTTYFAQTREPNGSTIHSFHAGKEVAALAHGVDARVFETKMYTALNSNLNFSGVNDPAQWNATASPANGSGSIDVSTADAFGSTILGIERYFQMLAVFGRSTIQLWTTDPDPRLNSIAQTIGGTGLYSRNAKTTFANGDVVYLAQSGIRSLKARDSSNFAITSDVGSPVDPYVKDIVEAMTPAQIGKIQCVIEPKTGAFWISLGNRILVLSFYPSSKISAWSEFELPFEVDYMAVNDYGLAVRSGDDVYIYGGDVNQTVYDAAKVEVITPFLDAKDPASKKMFRAIDAAVEGLWSVQFNINPRNPGAWSQTSIVSAETYTLDTIPMQAMSTHIAFRLTTEEAAAAKVNALVVHYDGKQPT